MTSRPCYRPPRTPLLIALLASVHARAPRNRKIEDSGAWASLSYNPPVAVKHRPSSDWPERIAIDPEVCNGRPTIRGKRITVQTILEFLGAGESEDEILRQYPSLELADIRACQQAAALLMDRRYVIRKSA